MALLAVKLRAVMIRIRLLGVRGQDPPGIRPAMHPRSTASLRVAPRGANSGALPLSSRLAGPAPRRSRCSRGFHAAVLLPLLVGGCHHYAPGSLAELSAGDRVRTLLTQEQLREFDEFLPGGERAVVGTVVEADSGGLLLEVPVMTVAEGIRVDSYSQRLRIPAPGVADVEVRTLARGRTYALVGVAAVVVGAVVWDQVGRARRGGTSPPDPPSEDGAVVIRLGFVLH